MIVLTYSPTSILESPPCHSPMQMDLHDEEGKKADKKRKKWFQRALNPIIMQLRLK